MMTALVGVTYPAAGVMVASPATAPVSSPRNLGLCVDPPVKEKPDNRGKRGGDIGVQESRRRDRIDAQLTARVKTVPSEPQKPRAQGHQRDAMGPTVTH